MFGIYARSIINGQKSCISEEIERDTEYSDLRDRALKSEKDAADWYVYLKELRAIDGIKY